MECYLIHTAKKKTAIILFGVLLLSVAAIVLFNSNIESRTLNVVLSNNGFKSEIVTMEETVGNLLDKYGIDLGQGDTVQPGKEKPLQDGLTITIKRAMEIIVTADGKEQSVFLISGTVADALKKAQIKLSELDETSHVLNDPLIPGMVVMVSRVKKETITITEPIAYQVITRKDNTRDETHRRVSQQGTQGELQREYEVTYRDGFEISREFIGEKITKEPVDHIVMAGTLGRITTSRGETLRYAFSRVFEVTAYTHTGNATRTGVMPKVGHVAVDPRVIPLNSTIYIDFSRRWDHLDGFYKATDTGGVILGDIIDIFMDTEDEAIRFGRRRARVYLVR